MDLLEAKAEVVSILHDYFVVAYVAEGVEPPVVVIRDGNPYLEPGRTPTDWQMNLSLAVVGPPADNEQSSTWLDEAVQDILPRLAAGNWGVQSVTPELLESDGYLHPAVVINIIANITL
jgi:hypothetical protein